MHSREPVVIAQGDYAAWLDDDERNADEARSLLVPPGKGYWTFHQVSKTVNNARNEGEALAKEIGQRDLF